MDSNNNAELKTEQNKCLLSNASTSSIDSKSTCSSTSFKDINDNPDNTLENTSYIKEVYSYNYKQELKKIYSIIDGDEFTYIGMDTEFPQKIFLTIHGNLISNLIQKMTNFLKKV